MLDSQTIYEKLNSPDIENKRSIKGIGENNE